MVGAGRGLIKRITFVTLAVLTSIAGIGCSVRSGADTPDAGAADAPPPRIRVTADRDDLVFTFQDPKSGAFATASSAADVPEGARDAVVVTDLSLSPQQRQAGRYIYLTDLTEPRPDGTYPVSVASRYGFESQATGTATVAGGSGGQVVVYTAAWCGVCKSTKRLLRQWGVSFVDKDVEASRSAQLELASKAARANARPSGVPVIDVSGTLLLGLDEQRLRETLKAKGFL